MARISGWTAVLGAAALVPGCVSYEPRPLDAAAELAALGHVGVEGLVVQHAAPGDDASAANAPLDLADGLDERELVAVALTLNPSLAAKRLEAGEARAELIEAGLWPNPEIGVSWRTALGAAEGHSADADLLVDLLQPWRRAARVDAATAHVDEVAADVVAEEWRLVRAVRLARLDVLAAERSLALLTDETALRQRVLELTARRRASGEGTELETGAAEADLAEIRRDRLRAESELMSARRALNELAGLPPAYELRLTETGSPLVVTLFDDVPDAELERRLLAGRFELRAQQAAYARAESELRLAVQGQFPDLKLGLSFTRDADGSEYLGPGADLSIPLFDRNQGGIAAKANARDAARAEFVATLHALRAEAHGARADLRRARLEVDMQESEVLPFVARHQELVERAFAAHEISILDRIAAEERALRSREAYLDSVVRYQRAVIEVETATGTPLARPAGAAVPKQQ